MRSLHLINMGLWLADAGVSLLYAHSAPLAVIGVLGACLAAVMFWIAP
jgi:hypothetical protein